MRLLLGILIPCLTVLYSLGACADQRIKIGFLLATLQDERYKKDVKFFKDEAEKLGFEPIILSSDNKTETQAARFESLLAGQIKALVIQPVDVVTAGRYVKMAHDKQVPVISYDHLIEGAPVDFYVSQDSKQVGVLQAETAIKFLKEKYPKKKEFNFVILKGPSGDNVAQAISEGIHSVLSHEKAAKVKVEKFHHGWSPSLAMETVEKALTNSGNKVDAVLANNSRMAQGAIQALSEQGMTGKVFVAGSDADLAAIRSLLDDRQQLDVMEDVASMASIAAQTAFQLAKGERPKGKFQTRSGTFTIPTIVVPVYPISISNLEERIFSPGFHTKAEVFGRSEEKVETK